MAAGGVGEGVIEDMLEPGVLRSFSFTNQT